MVLRLALCLAITGTIGAMATTTETITVSSRIITLGPTSLPNGVQGIAYSQSVVANPAGTYNYAVTTNSLPPGCGWIALQAQLQARRAPQVITPS